MPAELAGHDIVANVSGGKDSTAVVLALREADVPVAALVFADTGWEHPAVYEHLDTLERHLGSIHRVRAATQMEAEIRRHNAFSFRTRRWCTRHLKLEPIAAFAAAMEADSGRPVAFAVGVRRQESTKRAAAKPVSESGENDGFLLWRPILDWSLEDVLRIHLRHGVPLNPLYRMGYNRVGCYPCIFSGKEDLRVLQATDPGRVHQIALLEREVTAARRAANAETPGRYAQEEATFFGPDRAGQAISIERACDHARTHRGGRSDDLFWDQPTGGCFSWGLCDPGEAA